MASDQKSHPKTLFENKSANILALRTKDGLGPYYMPTSWCMPVSYEPQLLAVCIGERRFSAGIIGRCDSFTLIVPSKKQEELVVGLGCVSGAVDNKVEKFRISYDSETLAIKESLGYAVCDVWNIEKHGTHYMMIGKVTKYEVTSDLNENQLFEHMVYSIGGQRRLFTWGEKL